jgi:hypothetical protein
MRSEAVGCEERGMSSFTLSLGGQTVNFNDAVQNGAAVLRDSSGDAFTNVFNAAIGFKAASGHLKLGVVGGSTGGAANVTIDETTNNGFLYTRDSTSAIRTVTFESASTVSGKLVAVKKCDSSANAVHGKFNGSETGDGANTFDLYDQYETNLWMSDASGWQLVGQVRPEPLQRIIADPGNAGAIPVTRSGRCALTSTGADTRTLAIPSFVGQQLLLIHAVDGGSVAITAASAINIAGNTIMTATAVRAWILLTASLTGSTKVWTVTATDGFTLS